MPRRRRLRRATSGPSMRGNGSRRASVFSSAARRRQHRVEPLEHGRALDLAGAGRRRSRARPRRAPRRRRGPTHAVRIAPEHAVDAAASRRAHPGAQPRARGPRTPSRSTAPGDERPDQPEHRRPAPSRAPSGSSSGPTPRAEPGAEREADQRERPGHEALRPPEQGEQDHDPHDDPVEPGHVDRRALPSAYLPAVSEGPLPSQRRSRSDGQPAPPSPLVGPPPRRRQAPRRSRARAGSRRCWPSPRSRSPSGSSLGSRHEPVRAPRGRALRDRVGARRLRGDALRCSSERRAPRVPAAAVQPRLPRGPPTPRRSPRCAPARLRAARADASTVDVTLRRRASSARIAGRLDARGARTRADGTPGIAWRPRAGLPRAARGRAARARDDACRPRAAIQARDGTLDRQAARPACPSSGRSRPRSPAGSARRRPSARRSSRAAACPRARPVGLNGLEREFDERLAGTPGGTLKAGGRVLARSRPQRGAGGAHHDRPRRPGGRGRRRSPAASAASRCCGRATARCSRWPGSPTARPSRPARRSRSSRSRALLDGGVVKRSAHVPRRDRDHARGRRARERQRRGLRRLAARSRSRSPATRSSPRWAPSSAPSGSSPPPSGSASTRSRGLPGAARSTIPAPRARSATTSRSARPRSARARCSPRRC